MSGPTPRTLTELPALTVLDYAPGTTDLLLVRQGGIDKKMTADLLPGSDTTNDVTSPNPSDDNALTRYDGITGKVIQSSNAMLDDAGNLTLSVALSETSGGTGKNTYAVGDILYASAINTLSKLAAGSNNNVLTLLAGVPAWSTPATSGTVTSVSGTAGRLTSTGGNDPVLDIDPSYVGQNTITTLGTVSTGVWNGSTINPTYGGTNQTTWATGDILYASGVNTLSKLPIGSNGDFLKISSGIPSWQVNRNAGVTWTDQATSFSAIPGNGYFCTGALTVGLPVTGSLANGDTISIYVDTASIVVVLANTGQFIQISGATTTSGGNATSSSKGSSLTLVFRVADTSWHAVSSLVSWSLL